MASSDEQALGVFDGWVMSQVWIAPTKFVKSSNLRQVVDVAEKDALG